MSELQWSKELDGIPKFTIHEIEAYFTKYGKTIKTGKTVKRTEELLADNFDDCIKCCNHECFFYTRAICGASYRKQNHQLSLALKKTTAHVSFAYCTCHVGKGGYCNHMYGLMKIMARFALEKINEIPVQLPCTSKPCGWPVPKMRELGVRKPSILESVAKKKKTSAGVASKLYDARTASVKVLHVNKIKKCQQELSDQNCVIPFTTCVRDETFSSTFTETKYGQASIFSPLSYQSASFGEQFQLYTNIEEHVGEVKLHNGVYPSFPHCEVPCYYSPDSTKLSDVDFIIVDDLQISMADSWKLELDTRGQSQCAAWVAARQNRVTASRIHGVWSWKRNFDKHADKFLSNPGPPSEFVQRRFDHGNMYEPIAWKKYKECFSFKGKSVDIFPSGIVVNPNNYWLGCTPDAKIVYEGYCGIGESKCPYNYRNSDLMFVAKSTDNFYLEIVGENMQLKHNHEYYFQVQCQLALTGASFADFIVYTFKSLFVQRIYFDKTFWESIVKTVGNNYFHYIVPKIAYSNT